MKTIQPYNCFTPYLTSRFYEKCILRQTNLSNKNISEFHQSGLFSHVEDGEHKENFLCLVFEDICHLKIGMC